MLGVDFSSTVSNDEWTLVVPIRKHGNVKMIFTAFSAEIWLMLISASFAYIIIFGIADYIFYGKAKWGHLAGFTTRTAMIESVMKPLHMYQGQVMFVSKHEIPFIQST